MTVFSGPQAETALKTALLATAGWIVYNAIGTFRTPNDGMLGVVEGHEIATEVRARLLDCGCDVAEAIVHVEPCERDAG